MITISGSGAFFLTLHNYKFMPYQMEDTSIYRAFSVYMTYSHKL